MRSTRTPPRRLAAGAAGLALVLGLGAGCSGSSGKRAIKIPRPHEGRLTKAAPNLPRGPEMPPDTVPLQSLYQQGRADVLK